MNEQKPRKEPQKDPFKWIRRFVMWHRYAGLSAALFVAMFAITGVLLNHSRALGLNNINASADWVMWWYDIPEPIITLERIVIDIHSGRFFGLPGVVMTDLAALAMLFLTISGVYTWFKKR